MTLPASALSLFRPAIVFAALVGAALPSARASGRNHDLQTIRIPSAPAAFHDRAPAPTGR